VIQRAVRSFTANFADSPPRSEIRREKRKKILVFASPPLQSVRFAAECRGMARNFYLRNEAEIVSGSAIFAARLASDYASYGISLEQATNFGLLDAELQSAYADTRQPATRTSVAVSRKNDAITNMRANAIQLSRIISANPAVDDPQLMALGLLPRATRTRRKVPPTSPFLHVISMAGRVVGIQLSEPESNRRGLPFGAASANIYSYVGDTAPTDPRAYHFEGATTRAKTQIRFPSTVPSGATVWLCACWVSGRGERGIGGTPTSFTIQGGAIPAVG
jgi:hypothetical protein